MDDDDARPTAAMKPLEKADSQKATVAMPPLFRDAEDGIPDREVAGYTLEREIGRGAMGIVYAAANVATGERRAVKLLRPELGHDRKRVERFHFEAHTASAIGHTNIVQVLEAGTLANGRPFLVMELLEGESLRARLARGPLELPEVLSILDACAGALGATHACGIVHRDLKPDNIFLVPRPRELPLAKLLDFGLVKLTSSGSQDLLTQSGALVGTPGYMSPEQIRAKPVDHRSDIYALGVLAYECLTGKLPYRGDSALDVMIQHVTAKVPPVLAAAPDTPEPLARIVAAMMAKQPEQRATLADLREALAIVRGDAPAPPPPAAPPRPRPVTVKPTEMVEPLPPPPRLDPSPRVEVPAWWQRDDVWFVLATAVVVLAAVIIAIVLRRH